MKLNNDEITVVKQLVANNVKFNETYVEVYDHVITALESQVKTDDIQKVYDQVIECDFGGKTGLLALERSYKERFTDQVQHYKWAAFWSYFKWPLLPGTILITALVLYIVSKWGVWDDIQPVMIGLTCGPLGVILSNTFLMKRKGLIAKKTIKYSTFFYMAVYTYLVYIVIMAGGHILGSVIRDHKLINDVSMSLPIIMTICFLFCVIHTLALLKAYSTEIKKLTLV